MPPSFGPPDLIESGSDVPMPEMTMEMTAPPSFAPPPGGGPAPGMPEMTMEMTAPPTFGTSII